MWCSLKRPRIYQNLNIKTRERSHPISTKGRKLWSVHWPKAPTCILAEGPWPFAGPNLCRPDVHCTCTAGPLAPGHLVQLRAPFEYIAAVRWKALWVNSLSWDSNVTLWNLWINLKLLFNFLHMRNIQNSWNISLKCRRRLRNYL